MIKGKGLLRGAEKPPNNITDLTRGSADKRLASDDHIERQQTLQAGNDQGRIDKFNFILPLLKLAAIGFTIGLCNVWRLPYITLELEEDYEGCYPIIYAFLLVIIGGSLNIFLKLNLKKDWITQHWHDVKPATLLTYFPCLVRDKICSSIHRVVIGLKSIGKVLLVFGGVVCVKGNCVTAVVTPYWELMKNASLPDMFLILMMNVGILMVCITHPPLGSQVLYCVSVLLIINCYTLLVTGMMVCYSDSFMAYVTGILTTQNTAYQLLTPQMRYALFIVVLAVIVIDVKGTSQAIVGRFEEFVARRTHTSTQQRRLSAKAKCIPLQVYSRVSVMLNVKRILRFDDFRMLAEKTGLDRDEIDYIGQLPNPTDTILVTWSSRPDATVGRLIELLKEEDFNRMDVTEVLENWVNEE